MSAGVSVGQLVGMDADRRSEVIRGLSAGARQKLAHLAGLSVQSSLAKAHEHLDKGYTAWVGDAIRNAHDAAIVAAELTAEEER